MNFKHNDTKFIGEDRSFGGSELFVDLIPKSCWFSNVRYCVSPEDWNVIRKKVYSRVGYTCECCFVNCIKEKIPIEAHERWSYDYDTHTQKLIRLVGLCKPCHQVTHIGLARVNGLEEEALQHLKKVRGFGLVELKEHIDMAYAIWSERNQYVWNLDLSLITTNGYKLVNPTENLKPLERVKITSEKLNK